MTPARRRSRLRGALGVVFGCLLLATACGDDEPAAAPASPESSSSVATSAPDGTSSPAESSTSASPTPSPTPTLNKPTLPPEAQVEGDAGATAFVYYWWDVYNYALATGDHADLAAISSDECVFCASLVEQITKRADQQQRLEGGEVTVVDAAAPPDAVTTVYRVGSALRQDSGKIVDEDGETAGMIKEFTRGRGDALVFYEDGAWTMDGMDLEVFE